MLAHRDKACTPFCFISFCFNNRKPKREGMMSNSEMSNSVRRGTRLSFSSPEGSLPVCYRIFALLALPPPLVWPIMMMISTYTFYLFFLFPLFSSLAQVAEGQGQETSRKMGRGFRRERGGVCQEGKGRGGREGEKPQGRLGGGGARNCDNIYDDFNYVRQARVFDVSSRICAWQAALVFRGKPPPPPPRND